MKISPLSQDRIFVKVDNPFTVAEKTTTNSPAFKQSTLQPVKQVTASPFKQVNDLAYSERAKDMAAIMSGNAAEEEAKESPVAKALEQQIV